MFRFDSAGSQHGDEVTETGLLSLAHRGEDHGADAMEDR